MSFMQALAARALPMNDQLWKIVDKVDQIASRVDCLATIFSSRDLDSACLRIGSELCTYPCEGPPSDCSVYLVTGLASSGGHTRVLRDLIRADAARSKIVLISQTLDSAHRPGFEPLFKGLDVAFRFAPLGPNLVAKIQWVQEQLASLRPGSIFMLIHGYDVVHTAAAQPQLCRELFYLHNVDHSIALGVHLPHACHLDFHSKGLWQCKAVDGVAEAHVIPLVADDLGQRTGRPLLTRGHLTSATSGGFEKFSLQRYGRDVTYGIDYVDGVAAILAASRGTHFHFGPLPVDFLSRIEARLDQMMLPRDRFRHWDFVPSLWESLLEQSVDVYVGSFPLGGGRATVEAMGAALPLIIHSNYWSNYLSVECEVYEGAMLWRTYEQLSFHISAITDSSLREHSMRSRAYYELHHTPDRLSDALGRARSGARQDPPRPRYHPDALRRFFDFHSDCDVC